MGKLLPKNGTTDTTRLEVDGDWYDIKTQISGWDRSRINSHGMVQVREAEVGKRPKKGEKIKMETQVKQHQLEQFKIAAWLTAWSHNENITSGTIGRLPSADYDAILDKIEELEEAADGPDEDDPLAESSNGSSGKTSKDTPQTQTASTTNKAISGKS